MSGMELLRAKYPSNAYAVLAEVRDAAGFYAGRSGDALVMSLWPSRGLTLQGFEIKASRSDWLRELKRPEKAESLWGYCDRWWLLTEDEKVAQLDEIPETWGWMSVVGARLKVLKEAPNLAARAVPISRSFLAALLKRAVGTAPAVTEIKQAREAGCKEGEQRVQWHHQDCKDKLAALLAQVKRFETASGLSIEHGWNMEKLGADVKHYMDFGLPGKETVRRYRDSLAKAVIEADAILAVADAPAVL